MTARKGFYSTGSKTRHRLIEAASELLAEEGYPAFSARRIAGRAKVKPQLVHYYFRSMEDLVVTVFKRSSANYYRLHDAALSSPSPLRSLWKLNSSLPEAKRMFEYIALGKQYPALREEMRRVGERFRDLQINAIEQVLADRGIDKPPMAPAALVMLMSSTARNLVIESQVGLSTAHRETCEFIEDLLGRIEAEQSTDAETSQSAS